MSTSDSRIAAMSTGAAGMLTGGLVAASIGFLLFFATAKVIESDSNARFRNHARTAQNTISVRIKSYMDLVRGAASLFQASNDVSRAEFHDYVAGLELKKQFPAVENINFAQFVLDTDMAAFNRDVRREAAAAGYDPDSYQMKPPGRRPDYLLVKYVEPDTSWWETLGLDLHLMQKAARVALSEARDSARLSTSGRAIHAISRPNQIALGMRLPLYRKGAPLATVADRRSAYRGSVGIAFSVNKLVNGVLDEMPIKNVRMTLVDRDNHDNSRPDANVLYDSTGTGSDPAPLLNRDGKFVITLPIDYNGRRWEATFSTDKRSLYSDFDVFFPWVSMGAGFISALMVYALFHTMSRSRRNAITLAESMTSNLRDSQTKLQLSHEKLRRSAAHAEQIKEGERKRIAREIHDDLGQNLLALRIETDMLAARTGAHHPHLHARAQATLQQIDTTIRSVRQIINDLRPTVLDLGLSAAVEWQIHEFERRTGISCELLDDHEEVQLLDDHCATAVFRVLQESLSNISRHAHAAAVRVELAVAAGQLTMTVTDNGTGFVPGGRGRIGSFGLVGIEERINLLGGASSVVSSPGRGTTVWVSLPISGRSPPPGTQPRPQAAQIASALE